MSDPRARRVGVALLGGAGAVALVSGVVALLDGWGVPALSLGALYVFAVLPAAVVWGAWLAVPVGIGSMLAFNFLFLEPRGTFHLRDEENWVVLALYLVVAIVTSELAARARRRAAEAERREQEAALLTSIAASLLAGSSTADELETTATHLAGVLGTATATLVLGSDEPALEPGACSLPLVSNGVRAGTLLLDGPARAPERVVGRLLPAVASLLLVAAERERLQREALTAETLRASDAAKTTILRSVSHDLRSPLTAIRAAADGLRHPGLTVDPDDRADLIATIALESHRLDRLVADLLDLSRLEVGALHPALALWPADELIGRALHEVDGGDTVEVDVPDDLPAALVDATQIDRALVNVLENARSHAREHVVVSARREADRLVIRVSDDGPGVSAADAARVFEPFQRGAGPAGSGLGLAIARGFVEANGGALVLEASDAGATFAFRLPAEELEAEVDA